MDQIALAIGRNENGKFNAGHFGDSDYFVKYLLHSNGSLEELSKARNINKDRTESHGSSGKLKGVLEELGSIQCVVSGKMSPNFKKMAQSSSVQPVVIRFGDDSELLDAISAHRDRLFELVAEREGGAHNLEVPVI